MGFDNPLKIILDHLLAIGLLALQVNAFANVWQPQQLMEFTAETCRTWEETGGLATDATIGPVEQSKIEARGMQIGVKHRARVANQVLLELDVIERGGCACSVYQYSLP